MSARETIRNVLLVHYADSPNPALTADTLMVNALREGQEDILIVARFDTAIEPAPEEAPVLTIGAIADDGRPVALLLDVETRRKVAGWLAPAAAEDGQAYDGELAMLRGLVRTLRVVVRPDASAEKQRAEARKLLWEHANDDASAREEKTAPDFFQPGRTYRNGLYAYRCDAVGPHPTTGETRATGWLTHTDRQAPEVWPMDPDDWAHGEWTDVTEGGAADV